MVFVWADEGNILWKDWSDWLPLTEQQIVSVVPRYEGAYVLRVRRGAKGPSPGIPRMLGRDKYGVLDIGQSRHLRSRLIALLRCTARDGQTGHMAGWRYRYLKLHQRLPGLLEFSFVAGPKSYRTEAELMGAYLDAFGELPPLNYKANWSLYVENPPVVVKAKSSKQRQRSL